MSLATISPRQLHAAVDSGQEVELVDVRTPAEYEELHVSFAVNIPLDRLDPDKIKARRNGSRKPLYVICRSGSRGKQACEKLLAAGNEKVVNVEGGTLAWEGAGFPVVRGRKTSSLERQVRIGAGLLVLTGTVLGLFVHPYWLAMAAFVGAGLTYAGITDTCGMAMILAKMPWNQSKAPTNDETPKTGMCCS